MTAAKADPAPITRYPTETRRGADRESCANLSIFVTYSIDGEQWRVAPAGPDGDGLHGCAVAANKAQIAASIRRVSVANN